jgi:hypothetical protein
MRRAVALACALVVGSACGGSATPPPRTSPAAETRQETGPADPAAPREVPPWPETEPGAVWTVLTWDMNDAEAEAALRGVGLSPEPRTDDKGGRVESLTVPGAASGWKASVTFAADTGKVDAIVVRGDPVSPEAARDERKDLEERFGTPTETRVRWSKQCGKKAVAIEGARPSWRITQTLLRETEANEPSEASEAKGPVEWPSLSLSWGMPVKAARAAMKAAGFVPEKLPKLEEPPPPKPRAKKTRKPRPKKEKPPPVPGLPPGAKLVELGFKKGDEHVQLSLVDKTGLYKVAVGKDVPDRKTAEERARDAALDLGACLSEAETEATTFRDAKAEVELKITGFQGQRIVYERYRPLGAE